jgi:hypothetical protein
MAFRRPAAKLLLSCYERVIEIKATCVKATYVLAGAGEEIQKSSSPAYFFVGKRRDTPGFFRNLPEHFGFFSASFKLLFHRNNADLLLQGPGKITPGL